jgi:NTE family protein
MSERIGLVLSGGGARGAYEAGVLAGVLDVVGEAAASDPLFDVLTGTSIGAINVAYLAAYADAPDRGIRRLVARWQSLRLESQLRPQVARFFAWPRTALLRHRGEGTPHGARWGRALLDVRPFEHIVADLPWARVHENVGRGLVQAFIVSALEVARGRTVSFVELGPGAHYVPSRDPRRVSRLETVTGEHVLASAAMPLLLPARRVEGAYYCDGTLRFHTPIAPAIRAGADRLLVIALRANRVGSDQEESLDQYPNPTFLFGKILDALLLDPIDDDLRALDRTNRILRHTAAGASPGAIEHAARVVERERGLGYRSLPTLVFRPSQDIGVLAREHVRRHPTRRSNVAVSLLERVLSLGEHAEADLLSYLLFDHTFAETLIELGRRDARVRADDVRAFFARGALPTSRQGEIKAPARAARPSAGDR